MCNEHPFAALVLFVGLLTDQLPLGVQCRRDHPDPQISHRRRSGNVLTGMCGVVFFVVGDGVVVVAAVVVLVVAGGRGGGGSRDRSDAVCPCRFSVDRYASLSRGAIHGAARLSFTIPRGMYV